MGKAADFFKKKKTGKPSSWLSHKKNREFRFQGFVKVIMLLTPVKSFKVTKLKLKQEY